MQSPKLLFVVAILIVVSGFLPNVVAAQGKSLEDIFIELEGYAAERIKELRSAGKRIDAAKREEIDNELIDLAGKRAAEAATRSGLAKTDFYYLGRIYGTAGNNAKVLESMKRFLSEFPPETKGDMIQSARAFVIAYSAQKKLMPDAESAFALWKKGTPMLLSQQPGLQSQIAIGYYTTGEYEKAVAHAQEAFEILKTLKAKTLKDKHDREQQYMSLIEVLAMSYRKSKNSDQALSVLAEARAESFAIPSAELYRKVMDFVEGSGFSEKKLMQKVESYASADAAPGMSFAEWIGHEPIALEHFRGRVVLLDFWATWCGPCISTFPRLRSWYKKYGGDDFIIVGVTQYYGEQGGKKMSKLQELDFLNEFKAKHKLPYPFAIVGSTEARMKYGINAYPTTVLLDRRGVIRYIGIGAGAEESENLEDMIKKVLNDERNLATQNPEIVETADVRPGERLDADSLARYLSTDNIVIEQFPAGSSNLTYLIKVGEEEFVLRRPPFGNTVKTAHDMKREFDVLSKLATVYKPAPRPILFCDDESVIGSEFYLMERRHGLIIRGRSPEELNESHLQRKVCESFVHNLAELHALEYNAAGLGDLGHPDGYCKRQVDGWTKRYIAAKTHDWPELENAITWLNSNIATESGASLVHNDYKFDNVMLDPNDLTTITAVLDWEMVTVGDPLMDLGTTLGYWMSQDAGVEMLSMPFNPRVLMENVSRTELAEMYAAASGRDISNILFYYVFGTFKIAVIAQQIYARFVKGFTKDPRFGHFDKFVAALGRIADSAIERNTI